MGFVAVTDHYHIVELSANLAPRANGGGTVDFCAHVDGSVLADSDRPSQAAALHDLSVAAYVDRAMGDVDDRPLNSGSILYKEHSRVADEGVGRR